MTWPVYSKRFTLHIGTGPWTYTVPAGKTAVIRNITGYNGDAAAASFYAQINGTTFFSEPLPGASSRFYSGLAIVLNEGDVLTTGTTNASVRMSVHGHLLTNPPAAVLEDPERGDTPEDSAAPAPPWPAEPAPWD